MTRFFHSFLHSSLSSSVLRCTSFSLFLSHPLVFTTALQLSHENLTERQQFTTTPIHVDRCRFTKIHDGSAQGGAIYASVPVKLSQSHFEKCEAVQGGALFSMSALDADSCTFHGCRARASGAIDLRFGDHPDVTVRECTFHKERSDLFGVLFRMSKGTFLFESSNGTKTRADQCVGFMEAKYGSMEMRYVTVIGASAHTHNGAICVRLLDQLLIEHCAFVNTTHCTSEHEAAAVLLCYENAYDSAVVDCAFLWSQPNASYTVNVLGGGHRLLIERCCFTGTQERELAPRLVRLVDTQFGQQSCATHAPIASETAPQTAEQTDSVAPAGEPVFRASGETGLGRRVRIAICVLVSLTVAACLTAGQVAIRNRWNEGGKNAKAIL